MTRTYWLSFTDADRPEGQQFLGVVVIDVDAVDAAAAKILIDRRFPRQQPGAEWIAAATMKAHRLGCNPGGEVLTIELPADHPPVPHDRLLSRADLVAAGIPVVQPDLD